MLPEEFLLGTSGGGGYERLVEDIESVYMCARTNMHILGARGMGKGCRLGVHLFSHDQQSINCCKPLLATEYYCFGYHMGFLVFICDF